MAVDPKQKKAPQYVLRALERNSQSPLSDMRLPPSDVFAHLADRQVYRGDINRIQEYVRTSWPSVKAIECSVETNGHIYFHFQIEPYSRAKIAEHQELMNWIRENIVGCRNVLAHFCPPLEIDRFKTSMTIYSADGNQPSCAHNANGPVR